MLQRTHVTATRNQFTIGSNQLMVAIIAAAAKQAAHHLSRRAAFGVQASTTSGHPSSAATFQPCSTGALSGLRAPRVASRGSTGAATPDLVAHRLGAKAADPAAKPRTHSHSQEPSNQESI